MRYEHIISAFAAEPWAMQREKLEAITRFMAFKARGGHLSPHEVHANIEGRRDGAAARAAGDVMTVMFNWTDAAYAKASALFLEDDVQGFRIDYPDGATEDFNAIVTGKPGGPIEVDSVRRFSLPMKVSGLPVYTEAGA